MKHDFIQISWVWKLLARHFWGRLGGLLVEFSFIDLHWETNPLHLNQPFGVQRLVDCRGFQISRQQLDLLSHKRNTWTWWLNKWIWIQPQDFSLIETHVVISQSATYPRLVLVLSIRWKFLSVSCFIHVCYCCFVLRCSSGFNLGSSWNCFSHEFWGARIAHITKIFAATAMLMTSSCTFLLELIN